MLASPSELGELDLTERQRHALSHASDRRMSFGPLGAPKSASYQGRWATTLAVERHQGAPWLWMAGAVRLREPDARPLPGLPMLVAHWESSWHSEATDLLAELLKGVGAPFDAHAYMARCGVAPGSQVSHPLWRELTPREVRVVNCGLL